MAQKNGRPRVPKMDLPRSCLVSPWHRLKLHRVSTKETAITTRRGKQCLTLHCLLSSTLDLRPHLSCGWVPLHCGVPSKHGACGSSLRRQQPVSMPVWDWRQRLGVVLRHRTCRRSGVSYREPGCSRSSCPASAQVLPSRRIKQVRMTAFING